MAETTPQSPPAENPLLRNAGALLANPYPLYAMLRANNPVFRLPIPAETGTGASSARLGRPMTPRWRGTDRPACPCARSRKWRWSTPRRDADWRRSAPSTRS